MQKGYTVLQLISLVLKLVALLIVGFGLYLALSAPRLQYSSGLSGSGLSIEVFIISTVVAVLIYAYGELIDLLIQLELNTRLQAHSSKQKADYAQQSVELLREMNKQLQQVQNKQ